MPIGLNELKVFEAHVDQLTEFHQQTARQIWPDGCWLRCVKCDRRQKATVAQIARYLAGGWPSCCRETMQVGDAEHTRN